jgi:tetrapyrrole methylase family protein/MazG family protein
VGFIRVVGIGQAEEHGLPDACLAALRHSAVIVTAPATVQTVSDLGIAGVQVLSYEEAGIAGSADRDALVGGIVALAERGDVAVASAGYPFMREGLVSGLLTASATPLEVLPGVSPLQALLLAFDVDITADVDIIDARSLRVAPLTRGCHLVVTGVSNLALARRVAERLSETFDPGHPAVVAHTGGDALRLAMTTIGDLAASVTPGEDAAVYVSPVQVARPGGFDELVRIMAILREPQGGCPWDLAQDHMSLRTHMIEEAYEAVEAIEAADERALAEELGDVLLQIVFHARIAEEAGAFDIDDVTGGIVGKLRHRHPHIFGTARADTPAAVLERWEALKREEKGKSDQGLLDSIPHALPALMAAQKISRRAVSVGFEWDTVEDVWDKVAEETAELRATQPGTPEALDEVGDLLFTVVNVARKMGVDAEEALRAANAKFRRRFGSMEREAAVAGRTLADMDMEALEAAWQRAKLAERAGEG